MKHGESLASITFEDVGKRFASGHVALRHLDLSVGDGEFMVLVGPSGCGKSTALRIVAGLDAPTSGRLMIGARLANGLSPRERDIAMMFQSYALYPHLTVAENIGFGLKVRGRRADDIAGRVREVAASLELADYLARKPAQLSGGQRQRVAMARALVRSPNALLMDEPLSNLDARLRGHMREEIASLQRRTGVTTLYVTHDQVEAMTMGSRVAVLDRGALQQVGPPRLLYDAPDNRFVAGFIGSPAMNFFEGRLGSENDAPALELGPHRIPLAGTALARIRRPAAATDGHVVLGVRPEALRPAGSTDSAVLPATVHFVEDLGATRLLSVEIDGARPLGAPGGDDDAFAASRRHVKVLGEGGSRAAPGDMLKLALDRASLHLFDAETGVALRP